ncbi:4-hydroxybenzoate octaprenyltransferase [Wohlfahrtiimonas chitiniclastica]|nr:4-hydroxybenzoate octaprenyltransferase [Wohlfahrtiimonas chitiniclastica]
MFISLLVVEFTMLTYKHIPDYLKLIRFDKPIGTLLLLWPTVWAVWIASDGAPDLDILIIFVLGVFIMRSAGCIMNDIADKDFDPHVERTKDRPLAARRVTVKEAYQLLLLFVVVAFLLALMLSWQTILLSIPALILALSYPFAKRYHSLPQAHLGIAFSFGIPMAFMQITGSVPLEAWLIFAMNILWTLAYDTEYAMSDREDDKSINIKSSALLFERLLGSHDYFIIIGMQVVIIALLITLGIYLHFSWPWWCTVAVVAGLFIHHINMIKDHDRLRCFQAFLHNNWVGAAIFLGLVAQYALNAG